MLSLKHIVLQHLGNPMTQKEHLDSITSYHEANFFSYRFLLQCMLYAAELIPCRHYRRLSIGPSLQLRTFVVATQKKFAEDFRRPSTFFSKSNRLPQQFYRVFLQFSCKCTIISEFEFQLLALEFLFIRNRSKVISFCTTCTPPEAG